MTTDFASQYLTEPARPLDLTALECAARHIEQEAERYDRTLPHFVDVRRFGNVAMVAEGFRGKSTYYHAVLLRKVAMANGFQPGELRRECRRYTQSEEFGRWLNETFPPQPRKD